MYQRVDGIVEFDPDVCIGCKACLQACPYDAIYVDPESGTAAKCHYCGHRVDLGLEPACVVVCPEHAIIAGDMDDPATEISRMLAENKVTVRRPEQGTAPKLFYVGGSDATMHPTAVDRAPNTFAWADVTLSGDGAPGAVPEVREPAAAKSASDSGTPIRSGQAQGLPASGPITIGEGRLAEQMVQVVYNAQHRIPWHWPVPAYLVTKAVAAGVIMLLALGIGFGLATFATAELLVGGFVSIVFTLATTGLLVLDLERPERFLRILTRPQWRSWLARGAVILIAFSTIVGVWWLVELAANQEWILIADIQPLRAAALWILLPLAVGAAVYTAFLFGQAEGRDLWQSTLLPAHLVIQAIVAGSAAMLVAGVFVELTAGPERFFTTALVAGLIVDLLVTFAGEFGMPHASEAAAKAAHDIHSGKYRVIFWWGSVVAGHLVPLALVLAGPGSWAPVAGLLAIGGLYAYEYAFVMAPQEIPNS
jgi:formate-dependent nitrite reductase membrane component NrfD/ferredoxin